jgi:16S rRNA (cytosine(1402)-N(4))-methyltransferase/cell division protein FtsL
VPVLSDEVLSYLQPHRGGLFVDCTVGLGGHARALIEAGASRLIGIDRDPAALLEAADTLREFGERAELVHGDYRELLRILDERRIATVDGILADLGVSSMQLDAEGRGFSFRRDEPLDMRMDTTRGETAAELLARVDETELADVIFQLGEERKSRRIARALVSAREQRPLSTTGQVADIVRRANRGKGWQRIDPATRTFQALRIWVNRELEGLDGFLVSLTRGSHREAHLPQARCGARGDQTSGGAGRRRSLAKPTRAQRQVAGSGAAVMEKIETFEYAIRKDVRNNPIVREVDERRQQELWQSIGMGCGLVLVLLFSAWQHFELLRHGYRLEQMQRERAVEEEINRHLRLEIETLRAPQRIEKLAMEQIGMIAPGTDEAIVLERVTPVEPPAKSLVAVR